MLDWELPLFISRSGFRGVAAGLFLGALSVTPVSAADRPGSVSGMVSVSASIVGSTGVVRPITSPLMLSTRTMVTGMAVELPRTAWLRSTGPADVSSALVLALSPSESGAGGQRPRTDVAASAGAATSPVGGAVASPSTIGPDAVRAGLIVGSANGVLTERRSGSAVVVSRADWRMPGYVSLAMTYE